MKALWFCVVTISLGLVVATRADDEFVAHEWGTFTSVQGADGVQMTWNPFIHTDLPGFVYNRGQAAAFGWRLSDYDVKGEMMTIVRMETPVIYFYSKEARTVDVTVKFPQGRITEWYPQATALGPAVAAKSEDRARAAQSFI